MPSNELLDAALLYASLGWRVFPLVPRGKNPAIKGWQDKATTDAAQIVAWWERNPSYNVGIKTGDGLCVIDVDDKPDKHPVLGSDMLREWELEHGDISETVCCQTPTGGMHYYFDIGDTRIDGCQSDTIFIDLRCDGNLIVAPPSIHPETGTAYVWDISPEDMKPTRANATDRACIQWVWDNRKNAGEGGKFTAPPIVHEGEGRDETLYKMACSMWAKNMPEASILAALRTYNDMCCVPPLPDRIVEQKVRSATSKKPGLSDEAKAVQKKPVGRPRKFEHNVVARKLINERGACFVDGVPAIFDGTRYVMGWDGIDSAVIGEHDDATMANQREVRNYIAKRAERKTQSRPTLIGFANGVLDIETMELSPYGLEHIIPNVIPHDWNPDAEAPLVDTVIEKMSCGDPGMMMNLAEIIGMCMFRSNRYGYAPILLGEGSNGKSTYIDVLHIVIGTENISALQPHEMSQRFQAASLAGKLANLGDDISSEYLSADACSVIKKVATGSMLRSDIKGGEPIKFKPYATCVFSANQFPRLADNTYGMRRRLFPIEFRAKFKRTDPDHDPAIVDKLTSEESCQYLCKIGVEGLRRVIESNELTPNLKSREMLHDIEVENDSVLQWIEDLELSPEYARGRALTSVYTDYKVYCSDNSIVPDGKRRFSKKITAHWHITASETDHEYIAGKRRTVRKYPI